MGELVFIFMPINPAKVGWRSATEWIKLRQKYKSPQKGITTLLEAPHRHFLVTPPSHFTPGRLKVLLLVDSLQVEDTFKIILLLQFCQDYLGLDGKIK
jgi:hypothetical protein